MSGHITLPPAEDLEPYIDLRATIFVGNHAITASIRGRASHPELVLSSVPSIQESEIFRVLVTGTVNPEDSDPDHVAARAAAILASLSNPALERTLNETLRVDRIGMTFGDSLEEPILHVGKNITRKIYAETQYHHGARASEGDNRAEVRVRYRISPSWAIESYFGSLLQSSRRCCSCIDSFSV